MDYKEEYLNALERAKKGLPIDEVFPELKESNDERIRKFLVELVSNDKANNYNGLYQDRGVHFDDVLAYLEKQKEPKPAEIHDPTDEELESHRKQLHDFKAFAAKQATEHHISFIHDFEWEAFCGELLSYFNEQQKPAEWSDEDETMLERCISKMTNIIPVPGKHGLEDMSFEKHTDDELITWLKFLPERFNLQPHWKPSEEQMGALLSMLPVVKGSGDKIQDILESLYNDLKKQI